MSLKITEIYAFIAVENGDEGIPAVDLHGMIYPLIGADMRRVDSLRAMAQNVATETGMPMTLARFTTREDLETITPAARQ